MRRSPFFRICSKSRLASRVQTLSSTLFGTRSAKIRVSKSSSATAHRNEQRQFLCGVETAQCLQGCRRLCGHFVAIGSSSVDSIADVRNAGLGDEGFGGASGSRFRLCGDDLMGLRNDTARNETDRKCFAGRSYSAMEQTKICRAHCWCCNHRGRSPRLSIAARPKADNRSEEHTSELQS